MIFLTEENKNENPKKVCLDPRDMLNPNQFTETCKKCKYLNQYNAIDCYHCGVRVNDRPITFSIAYKKGKHTYTAKEWQFAQDFTNKNYKDFLQPTRWNNATRKTEINPEFVKEYGNPYKKADVGSEVIKDIERGNARIVGDAPDTDKLVKKLSKNHGKSTVSKSSRKKV